MVTRTVIIDTEEHAKEFDMLVKSLTYVKQTRQLKPGDVALGIGSPYSDEELHQFLHEDESDNTNLDLVSSIEKIKKNLGTK